MSDLDVYTAIVYQPEIKVCLNRTDVRDNVARLARILASSEMPHRAVFNGSLNGASWQTPPWAPLKLVALPELCLNLPGAFYGGGSTDQLLDEIALEIPGPETEVLAQVCREQGFYLCCGAYEKIEALPGRMFNTCFIISPAGEVIHKAHKFNPYIPVERHATSPHDISDEYLAEYAPGKSQLDAFFPVTHTEIGAIGTLVCNDGLYPENWRALALRGAEIIIHGNLPEPFASPPHNWRELFARTLLIS